MNARGAGGCADLTDTFETEKGGQDFRFRRYGPASELLILADSGGRNGARCRLWKYELQENLVDRFQLAVTVCHYPTGASKWNPIEHRLFSEISKHWAGQPLTDYPTIVRLIGETKTQTGLQVHCALSTKHYPTEIKVSDEQMRELDLLKRPILPDWNYTLFPRINRNFCARAKHWIAAAGPEPVVDLSQPGSQAAHHYPAGNLAARCKSQTRALVCLRRSTNTV